MKYRKLGRTDLNVSQLCLGSMTWGSQNTADEAFKQIDYALDHGINFIDTAEMYPVNPISRETQGNSERIIGEWIAKTGRRNDIVLATKVSGAHQKSVRDGELISSKTIRLAVESSLKSLQTDVIDIYQLHWPNRGSYHFRQSWNYSATAQNTDETRDHVLDVLEVAGMLVKEGKIRHIGLSNESCWGTSLFLEIAERESLPRVATIQNEYNLMCRYFDLDLAELCHHENVDLLAFSPQAGGILTGKYMGDVVPPGSRRSHVPNISGRYHSGTDNVVGAYLEVAQKHGMDLAQMALAFCMTRPFMGSVIFGATSVEQLQNSTTAADITLSEDALADIAQVFRKYPIPF